MGDHPLRTPSHHRLGEPLPHQLANGPQDHLQVDCSFNNCGHAAPLHRAVLAPVSRCYPPVIGRLSTRYSPVRQSPGGASTTLLLRLACVKPAASVRPEPGSNSPLYILNISCRTVQTHSTICLSLSLCSKNFTHHNIK